MQAAVGGGYFPPASASTPLHLTNVMCEGWELGVWECEGRRVTRQHERSHLQDAGVICAGKRRLKGKGGRERGKGKEGEREGERERETCRVRGRRDGEGRCMGSDFE